MQEIFIEAESLPEAYHAALYKLANNGKITDCTDWNCTQKEVSMTMVIINPLKEPRISKCFIGGPEELEQYCQEILYGILDFEISKGNWKYTYHDRIANYPTFDKSEDGIYLPYHSNQIEFIIDELHRNPASRRAVIDIRNNSDDMYSKDPACLQHIQYFIRDNKLDCCVLFRSNDACKATFMNAFALICLQELIANKLNIEVGTYTHRANSFHCYEKDFKILDSYKNRIQTESIEDLSYSYKNDWKELMDDFQAELEIKINKLKKQ